MDQRQFDNLLHDAEVKMKRLKALYEQWFQGMERIEPLIARKDLERTFVVLFKEKPRNTASRFKFQQLHARYVTYQTYWTRIARKIEEGTYERDLRRVRRRAANGAQATPGVYEIEIEEDLSEFDNDDEDALKDLLDSLDDYAEKKPEPAAPKARPLSAFSPMALRGASASDTERPASASRSADEAAAPPKKAAVATFGKPKSRRPPPADGAFAREQTGKTASIGDGFQTDRAPAPAAPRPVPRIPEPARVPTAADPMRDLYDNYVAARRSNNEQVDMEYDKMKSRVQQMRSQLEQKHAGKNIDFEVVVQNGRVGLRPKID